jgi:hypothetical protein
VGLVYHAQIVRIHQPQDLGRLFFTKEIMKTKIQITEIIGVVLLAPLVFIFIPFWLVILMGSLGEKLLRDVNI